MRFRLNLRILKFNKKKMLFECEKNYFSWFLQCRSMVHKIYSKNWRIWGEATEIRGGEDSLQQCTSTEEGSFCFLKKKLRPWRYPQFQQSFYQFNQNIPENSKRPFPSNQFKKKTVVSFNRLPGQQKMTSESKSKNDRDQVTFFLHLYFLLGDNEGHKTQDRRNWWYSWCYTALLMINLNIATKDAKPFNRWQIGSTKI